MVEATLNSIKATLEVAYDPKLIRLAILVSYGGAGVKVCRDCAECSGVLYVGIGDSGLVEEAEFFQLSEGCSSAVLELVRELEICLLYTSPSPRD